MTHAAPANSTLTVRTLGSLDIRADGNPITPKRARKAKLLLVLMATQLRREVSREWLASRLWPDSDPISAAHNLRQTLADLRQALGPAAGRIEGSGRTLKLLVDTDDVDIARFDRAIARDDLAEAVDLYTGPFLEGIDDPWTITERENRHRAVLTALDKLASISNAKAVEYRRRAVALAPLDEVVLRNLLIELRASGDHAGMVDAVRAFERTLAKEDPFARPSGETIALLRETRAETPRPARPHVDLPSRPPLPSPLTELIGRDIDVDEIVGLLDHKRLVTLTGPGGVGKTRLAVAIANRVENRYYNGAAFVDLAQISDPEVAPSTVALALGLVEALGRVSTSTIIEKLRDAQLLLLIDNCEHVIDQIAHFVEMMLGRCPGVRVLATSREPLQIHGEKVWSVASLGFPREDDVCPGLEFAAMRLFVDRAVDARHNFQLTPENAVDVGAICRRLDGIPLALELAAVMVTSMDASTLASSLENRFAVLTQGSRNALPRHKTLQSVVDWGFELLTDAERRLLTDLSVFTGSWSEADARGVCWDGNDLPDLIARLVRKSLVVHEPETVVRTPDGTYVLPPRYRLLETIRQYGVEKLRAAGHEDDLRARHFAHFYNLLEKSGGIHPNRLLPDLPNLRAAMDWSVVSSDPEVGVRMCSFLGWFAGDAGVLAEGRARFEALLRRPDLQQPTSYRMRALQMIGWFATKQADVDAARTYFTQALDVADIVGDVEFKAVVLTGLVEAEQIAGDIEAALKWASESRRITQPDNVFHLRVSVQVGALMEMLGDYKGAREVLQECVSGWAKYQHDDNMRVLADLQLASVLARLGDLDGARDAIRDRLSRMRKLIYEAYTEDVMIIAARIALFSGQAYTAAVIFFSITRAMETSGLITNWINRPDFIADQTAIRAALTPDDYGRARAEADRMTLDDAVQLALTV